jgi:hypothetical protein
MSYVYLLYWAKHMAYDQYSFVFADFILTEKVKLDMICIAYSISLTY